MSLNFQNNSPFQRVEQFLNDFFEGYGVKVTIFLSMLRSATIFYINEKQLYLLKH